MTDHQPEGSLLFGELYLDREGEPHFICHTSGLLTFTEARTGIQKFISLLRRQLDEQETCPYSPAQPRNTR